MNDSRAEIFQHPTLYLYRGVGVVATDILGVSWGRDQVFAVSVGTLYVLTSA